MEISKFWMTVDNPYYKAMADLMLPDGTMRALQIAPLDPQKNTYTYHFPLNPENNNNSGSFVSFKTRTPLSKNDVVKFIDALKKEKSALLGTYDQKNPNSQSIAKSNVPSGISNLLKQKIEAPLNILKPEKNTDSGITIQSRVGNNKRTEEFIVLKNEKQSIILKDGDYENHLPSISDLVPKRNPIIPVMPEKIPNFKIPFPV
ncbi:MAG: hypothetical protein ACK53K_00965 [Burkholderiales bacterium]